MLEKLLEVRNLTKNYGRGRAEVVALKDVSFAIIPGEIVAVMGPSGCGKSTLLKILGMLSAPTSGIVEYDGKPSPSSEKERAIMRNKFIGYVHQNYSVIPYEKALTNVRIPLEYVRPKIPRSKQNVMSLAMLDKVNLGDFAKRKTGQLSGGEQQRIAIARAAINNPRALLADEPTAALDTQNVSKIVRLLKDLTATGTAVMVATHDPRVSIQCDRIFYLEDGKLIKVEQN